ncbi:MULTISPECIES: hypothetical protein [Paraburkholderia]|uniref:hypothetical protein n=1 Tax=Paraburkholderia TaxID=1822464 RepID=UPI002AB72638|nr:MULTISPECIES: hypothetical protein [Paraburkholderia]
MSIKSVEQQAIEAVYRMHAILPRHRTALINPIRGLLGERPVRTIRLEDQK